MRKRSVVVAVGFAALLTACGSKMSGPTAVAKDLRGSWGGTPQAWRWSDASNDFGETSRTAACTGTLDITSQDGSSFAGTYAIDCTGSGGHSSGSVLDGQVDASGVLSFRLRADDGWSPAFIPGWFGPACQVSGDPAYQGSVANDSIDVRRVESLDCALSHQVVSSFTGAKR